MLGAVPYAPEPLLHNLRLREDARGIIRGLDLIEPVLLVRGEHDPGAEVLLLTRGKHDPS